MAHFLSLRRRLATLARGVLPPLLGVFGAAVAASALAVAPVAAVDGWRMVLSWSPAYCEANPASQEPQCTEERYFVNHGLVPFRNADRPAPEAADCQPWRMSDDESDRWLWVIPNRDRVRQLWSRYGACGGLTPADYFMAVDRANRRVLVPTEYTRVFKTLDASSQEVRRAFVELNPGLTENAIDLICKGRRLLEVQICFDADFGFRACEARKECPEGIRFEPIRSSRIDVKPYG